MKRNVLFIVAAILLFALCSCAPEPEEYAIDEMRLTITDHLTLEEDDGIAKEEMVEAGAFDSVTEADEILNEVKYFYGSNYDLAIGSMLVSFSEAEFEECIDVVRDDNETEVSDDITIDGAPGKIGYYEIDSYETHFIYTLKNGIFYFIELSLFEGEAYPENYLDELAETITFDSELLGTKTVSCGDIEITVPENHAELEFEPSAEFNEEHYYGQYAKSEADTIEYGVCYSPGTTIYDYDVSGAIDVLSESCEDVEKSSFECDLGTYTYFTGRDAEGYSCMMALLEYKENIYWFTVLSESEFDTQNFHAIISSAADKNAE